MIKKFTTFVLMMWFGFSFSQDFPTTEWIDFANTSWYNDADDSFDIGDAESFAGLSVLVADGNDFSGKTIRIMNDIDLGAHLWQPVGIDFDHSFSGNVNGNGYKIQNLFINRPDNDFVGLFGSVLNMEIQNLNIENAVVHGKSTVGALVANLSTNSQAVSCHVKNAIVQSEAGFYGGIAGGLIGGLLTDSSVKWSSFSGEVYGGDQIGGLVGTAWDHTLIEESYSEGLVSGDNIVGGLVGFTTFNFPPLPGRENTVRNSYSRADVVATGMAAGGLYGLPETNGIIENSYSTGSVTGSEQVGGSIGAIQGDTEVTNVYFDMETSGLEEGIGSHQGSGTAEITGKTTADMKTQELVDLLNGAQGNIWTIDPDNNDGYPILAENNTLSVKAEPSIQNTFTVYPTIATDRVFIHSSKPGKFAVINLNGKVISSGNLNAEAVQLEVSHFSKGIYIVVFESDNHREIIKFIKN